MAFDILSYRDKYKDYYKGKSLDEVAQDVYSGGGFDKSDDYDTWKKNTGIDSVLEEDRRRRNPTFTDKLANAIESKEPSGKLRRGVVDPLVSLAKGVAIGLPETAVGLTDMMTGGLSGKAIDTTLKAVTGGGLQEGREWFDKLLSPEMREAKEKVADAQGFVNTIRTAVQNPSSIVDSIMESIPLMVGGAGLGRLAMKGIGKAVSAKGLSEAARWGRAVTAGAVGEGLVSAGINTEQLRQETEDGLLSPAQVAIMAGSGVATGIIGRMSGGLAKRLGITDVDTLLQGVNTGAKRKGVISVLTGLIESAIVEGALEELPQEAQETMAQNIALGKPAMEGVAEAGAMGLLAGAGMGMMGAGGGVFHRGGGKTEPPTYESTVKRLQASVYLNETIDNGLRTGEYEGKPFTPDHALELIKRGQGEGVFTPADLDTFKDKYPQLKDGLNVLIAENITKKVDEVVTKTVTKTATEEDVPGFEPVESSSPEFSPSSESQGTSAIQETPDIKSLEDKIAKIEAFLSKNEKSKDTKRYKQYAERLKTDKAKLAELTELPAPLSQTDAATVGVAKDEAKSGESSIHYKFGQIVETAKGSGKVVGLRIENDNRVPIVELENGKRVRLDTLEEPAKEAPEQEEAPQIEAKSQAELLDKFDNTGEIGSEQELIERLKDMDDLSEPMKAAIMDYDKAAKEDFKEYGMRSGLPEEAAEKVVALLKAEQSKSAANTEATRQKAVTNLKLPDNPDNMTMDQFEKLSNLQPADVPEKYKRLALNPQFNALRQHLYDNYGIKGQKAADITIGEIKGILSREEAKQYLPEPRERIGNLSRAKLTYEKAGGEGSKKWQDNANDRIEYELNEPMIFANQTDKWEAGIRYKGWAQESKKFKTREEAEKWIDAYDTGKIDKESWGPGAQFMDEMFGKGTYEKIQERVTPDNEAVIKAAITDAKKNGPSNEFRALFGGIEPEKAGTTNEKVSALAKELGLKWETPASPKAKQPWEMTWREYVAEKKTKVGQVQAAKEEHSGLVKTALSEGKPVPESVLKDYPDLVKGNKAQEGKGTETKAPILDETTNLVLHEMKGGLESGTPGGFQGADESGNAIYAKSGYPEWFSDLVKRYGNKKTSPSGEKESITAKGLAYIIDKGIKGDKLTPRQQGFWDELNKVADRESGGMYAGIVSQFQKVMELRNEAKEQLAEEGVTAGEIEENRGDIEAALIESVKSETDISDLTDEEIAAVVSFEVDEFTTEAPRTETTDAGKQPWQLRVFL